MKFGYGLAVGSSDSGTDTWYPGGTFGWAGSANTYFFIDPERRSVSLADDQRTDGCGHAACAHLAADRERGRSAKRSVPFNFKSACAETVRYTK